MRETKRKMENGEENTTILPFSNWSCMACWNKPLTAENGPTAPRAHGVSVSLPVHLTWLDGKVTLVCYVARCVECGFIKRYGAMPGIYKLNGMRADFGVAYWDEIKRNRIDPDKFIQAVLDSPKGPVWVDAKAVQHESRERAPFYEPKGVKEHAF